MINYLRQRRLSGRASRKFLKKIILLHNVPVTTAFFKSHDPSGEYRIQILTSIVCTKYVRNSAARR